MVLYCNSLDDNTPLVDFKTALFKGQPDNGELYTLNSFPTMSLDELLSMKGKPYYIISANIMRHFMKDIPYNDLVSICERAYDFDHPLEEFEKGHYIMRLDRGPTASFKDNAAVLMAEIMSYYLKKNDKEIIIPVATSGDTGGAVGNAFKGLNNIKVIILFPARKISYNQRLQMTTLGENITAVAVDGNFDDCQRLVTTAIKDLSKILRFSSANSINVSRLLPQMIYYVDAWLKKHEEGKDFIISVPSGNFGNLTAGLIVQRMGLPIKYITGTNNNSYFPEFYETGIIHIKNSADCSSSAMSVTKPSNMRRIFHMFGGRLDKNHAIIRMPDMKLLKKDIISAHIISEEEVNETIKWMYKYGLIVEPHGAVALAEWKKYCSKREDKDFVSVCFETADPAKFPEKIKEVLGVEPELPDNLKKFLDNASEDFAYKIPPKQEVFEKFLADRFNH